MSLSGRVGSAIFESGMVTNVGIVVEIASPAPSIQKLFQLPVSTSGVMADILDSRCRPMSGHVVSVMS